LHPIEGLRNSAKELRDVAGHPIMQVVAVG